MIEQLDQIDRAILDILQDDGGITNVELSRRIGLAPASTLERVRKLRQSGTIRRTVALLDAVRVAKNTVAYVTISLAAHGADHVAAFRSHVQALPEVMECYHVSGESDFLLKIVATDIAEFETILLTRLTDTVNIAKIHTSFVLSTVKHETRIPLGGS